MAADILKPVREEILNEDAKSLPWVPKNLDKTWETQAGMAGAVAGFLSGLALGAHMGLAGPWGAIAGTVPCAVIGGVIGYFTGAKVGSQFQRGYTAPGSAPDRLALRSAASPEPQIVGGPTCSHCGAPKSSWWDSKSNRCGKCRQSSKTPAASVQSEIRWNKNGFSGWICRVCSTSNSDARSQCKECSAARH